MDVTDIYKQVESRVKALPKKEYTERQMLTSCTICVVFSGIVGFCLALIL